jgi:hypothetical protein
MPHTTGQPPVSPACCCSAPATQRADNLLSTHITCH